VLARIVIGFVLLVAGAAKLRDRPADVPVVLPWVELVLGALLVVQVGGRWTATAALLLLTVFLVVVWRRVRRGDDTPCACFGQVSRAPVSYRTVARNAVLVVVALAGVVAR
jgi:methylamine utilization protein MauE